LLLDFKNFKASFSEILSEVQKDSEDVSAGIGKFLKILYISKKFVRNLMSKLARSTLTSPGRIRVNDGMVPLLELLGDIRLAPLLELLLAQNHQHVPFRLDAQLLDHPQYLLGL
jgi:hypothetical protein